MKIPLARPAWEIAFGIQLHAADFPAPECEYRFHPTRKWKFDFAWPKERVAIEVNGGIWRKGGGAHQGKGHLRDMEKMNEAQVNGWKVFQFTPEQMQNGLAITYLTVLNEFRGLK
jgi:very-short-patch-repair endonuclease